MKITVPRAAMRALMHLALQPIKRSEKNPDRRDYLRGICLEVAYDEVRMVATDGSVMGIFRSDTVAPKDIAPGEVKHIIVPIETVMKLKPIASKREKGAREWVRVFNAADTFSLVDGAETHFFIPINAAFPEHRRPTPKERLDGIAAQYNPDLLVRFADAAREFGGDGADVRLKHSSKDSGIPGLVKLACAQHSAADNFLGLIMPVECDADFTAPPSWALQTYSDREFARFMDLDKEAA